LIELIGHEEVEKNQLQKHADEMGRKAAFFYEDFVSADMQEDIDEIHVQHRFGTHARAAQAKDKALAEVDRLNRSIDYKQKSLESLSAALLQIAKQGISIAYLGTPGQSLAACPDGRLLNGQPIKTIIWQARNQTMHYDDPAPYRQPVITCFATLEADHGPDFALAKNVSFAYKIVLLLKWIDWRVFADDMVSLIG
jgi:hypothetical protein